MTGAYQFKRPVRSSERTCYAAGDAGFNFLWVLYDSFFLYFLVEIARLPAWTITPVVLCSRSADLVAGVLFGLLGDRVRTRQGTYRPYMIWLALPLSLTFFMLFFVPFSSASGAPLVLWTGGAAVLFASIYSVSNAAYTALLTVLTDEEPVRVRVAAMRFAFAAGAVLIVQYTAIPFASRFAGSSRASGWTRLSLLCAGVSTALLLVSAVGTHERLSPAPSPRLELQRIAKDIARERGLGWLIASMISCMAALSCRGAASPFYIHFVAGHVEWTGTALVVNSLAAFSVCLILPAALPQRLMSPLPLASVCAAAGAVLCLLAALWGSESLTRLLIAQTAFGAGTGLLLPTLFALLTSRPQSDAPTLTPALLAAGTLLSLKAGSAVGTLFVSSMVAHAANVSQPSAQSLHTIAALFTHFPAALFALTLFCMLMAGRQHRKGLGEMPQMETIL